MQSEFDRVIAVAHRRADRLVRLGQVLDRHCTARRLVELARRLPAFAGHQHVGRVVAAVEVNANQRLVAGAGFGFGEGSELAEGSEHAAEAEGVLEIIQAD